MAVKLTPQRRVLAMAASQIGYNRHADSKRGTKYARDTQPVFWPRDFWLLANGISYCDLFVTWVFWKALGKEFVDKGYLPAGASYNTDYRASKGGRVSKSEAAPGDVLVFDWNFDTASTNHVGILEKRLSGSRFQTIEGNTALSNVGSQGNGGRVARRVRRHDQVRYVIRPNWSKAGGTSESVADTKNPWNSSKTIASLSKVEIKEIQTALKGLGYDLGSYGVDGSYGKSTYNAVKKFQTASKLESDGVAGPDTRKALTAAGKGTPAPSKPKPAPSKSKAPAFPLPRKKGALYFYGIGEEKTAVTGKMKNTGVPGDVVLYKGKWHSKGLRLWQIAAGIEGDGRFGKETEAKVKALQKKHGVTQDGRIGPDTWKLAWA